MAKRSIVNERNHGVALSKCNRIHCRLITSITNTISTCISLLHNVASLFCCKLINNQYNYSKIEKTIEFSTQKKNGFDAGVFQRRDNDFYLTVAPAAAPAIMQWHAFYDVHGIECKMDYLHFEWANQENRYFCKTSHLSSRICVWNEFSIKMNLNDLKCGYVPVTPDKVVCSKGNISSASVSLWAFNNRLALYYLSQMYS